jgi:23S rRNA pseudouridine1911/1915/1917 synthase
VSTVRSPDGSHGGSPDGSLGHLLVAEAEGRLDTFVAAQVPALSRAQVKRLIEEGDVLVDDAPVAKAGHKLRAGNRVRVIIRPAAPAVAQPEAIALTVLFEDAHLIVIDKPPGLVVHPAPGHEAGTLVNALLAHCDDLSGIGGELRPGIVHRLDKDTSGVMVATKSDAAHVVLSEAFQDKRTIHREYLAVVFPAPPGAGGTIRTLYGRHPVDRKRFSSKVAKGKHAVTHWEVVERFASGAALVRLRLETGRTHQIRVHMADQGWPLLGDPVYGRTPKDRFLAELAGALGRQALHAARLGFAHPVTGEEMRFESALPADLAGMVARLRAGLPGAAA